MNETYAPLRAVIFDFDGVIADTEPTHFQALAMVGKGFGFAFDDYEQYVRHFIGFDDRDALRVMLAAAEAVADEDEMEAALPGLCEQKQKAFDALIDAGVVRAVPGALELMHASLDAGLPTAIASGATRADIDRVLAALRFDRPLDAIVTADDVAKSKPDPATYALAVKQLSDMHTNEPALEPAHGVAIEDTAAGVTSATAAGLRVLGITTTGPAEALRGAGAARVIDGLEDVGLDVLRELAISV